QCELMYVYDKLFSEYNHCVSQILMTRDIIDSPKRAQNVINTFEKLLSLNVIPIVNENDSVSVEEIEFGDNDTLSALVAKLANADALIILTDIDGLYDDDPRKNPNAKLIPEVDQIDERIESLAQGKGSTLGTGGMITKIHAAQIATQAGIPVHILNGADPNILYDLFDGKSVGTVFHP
ncbi:MAG: glutamate 5-kinase, partial [Oscillospiraceae bacterium]|nr:glutamate 5-kinase [Oscillospiraceae bacterium]